MPTLPVACRSDVGALGRGLRLGLDVRGRLPNLVTDEDDAAGEDYKAVKGAEDDANDDAIGQPVVGGRHDLSIRGTEGGCRMQRPYLAVSYMNMSVYMTAWARAADAARCARLRTGRT